MKASMASWNFVTSTGKGDLPTITCESADGQHSCEVYLFGATLTSWKASGEEKIFVSESAVYNGKKAIRGGIPIVFPAFGQSMPDMPQHGFARISDWEVLSTSSGDNGGTMVLGLSPNESTRALWSYDFQLEYTVSLTANSLKVDLKATNKHTDAFKCHTLFHTYFRIPSIVSARVTGYAGIPYIDKMRNCEVFVEDQAVIEIDREVDRVYMEKDTPMGDISIYKDPASLEAAKPVLTVKKYSAILDESGAKVADVPTDCVLWNPWIAKASSMPDLGGDAYPYFVCVEPGTVQDWVEVPAGKSLVLTNVFSV